MINTQTYKKNRSYDIVLRLKVIEGKSPKTPTGIIDSRLFSGGNTLHAKMDTQTCLWYLEYENGILPGALKQRFTGWVPLITYVTKYLQSRNVEIIEVVD